ncbi:MAG: FG-GAP-like repeat-containing protein [Myxococcota bacterium]|jgi:hypothetical protein|nr:FG-GAP-like repeat-containing protein [Myxococcota bacterium]
MKKLSLLLCLFIPPLLLTWGCGDEAAVRPPMDQDVNDGEGLDELEPPGDTQDHKDQVELPEDLSCPSGVRCEGVCCQAGQQCVEGVCTTPACETIVCGEGCCAEGLVCEEGQCVEACSLGQNPCGLQCCGLTEGCDAALVECTPLCPNGTPSCREKCCQEGWACESGQCRLQCESGLRCGALPAVEVCCQPGELCENNLCVPDCGAAVRCGPNYAQFCCEPGEVCEQNQCKIDCEGTRCGSNEQYCCTDEELCLFGACLMGHGACLDNLDCDFDEFCEPTVQQCIKVDDNPNQCIYVPPVGEFSPGVQWHWSASPLFPNYNQVMMTPIVLNLTDDNGDGVIDEEDIPDVVFGTFANGAYNSPGAIRVLSGDDGRELAASMEAPFSVSSDLAAADMDGDGHAEIVVSNANTVNPAELYVLILLPDGAGGFERGVRATVGPVAGHASGHSNSSAAFADLDGDGLSEVVTQIGIIDDDLSLHCEAPTSWPHAAVADLDGDGLAEIVASGAIYDGDCQLLASGGSGPAAIADLSPDAGGEDLTPEIIFVRRAQVEGFVEQWNVSKASDGTWSMEQLWATQIPLDAPRIASIYGGLVCTPGRTEKACNTGGGPPTIADFDRDGQPEIGLAARWYYLVYETDGSVLWADGDTQDYSSAVTGSSVFDFEGDGAAEVVYNDELMMRVYKGAGTGVDSDGDGFADPEVLFSIPNPSGTLYEYPLIVDVDNDGNAEIVLGANNYAFPGVNGIRVFNDPLDNWVRTRRIWNQHSYHVSNVEENGQVPSPERANWSVPRLNNYRQNVEPSGLFNAPNLQVSGLSKRNDLCPGKVLIDVSVTNAGALGVPPNVWVGVYARDLPAPDTQALLGRVQLPEAVRPGATVVVSFEWDYSATLIPSGAATTLSLPVSVEARVDDPPAGIGSESGEHRECVEVDNTSLVPLNIVDCPIN